MTAMVKKVKDQKTEDNFRSLISLKLLEIFKEFFFCNLYKMMDLKNRLKKNVRNFDIWKFPFERLYISIWMHFLHL